MDRQSKLKDTLAAREDIIIISAFSAALPQPGICSSRSPITRFLDSAWVGTDSSGSAWCGLQIRLRNTEMCALSWFELPIQRKATWYSIETLNLTRLESSSVTFHRFQRLTMMMHFLHSWWGSRSICYLSRLSLTVRLTHRRHTLLARSLSHLNVLCCTWLSVALLHLSASTIEFSWSMLLLVKWICLFPSFVRLGGQSTYISYTTRHECMRRKRFWHPCDAAAHSSLPSSPP